MNVPRVAVAGVILEADESGPKVVLVRRATPPSAGHWSLPGGRVEWGETIANAVAREVLEETGLQVTVGRQVEVFELITPEHHYVIHDHRCTRVGGTLRAGDDAAEVAWAPVFDLADFNVSADVRRVIAKALSDERE